MSSASIHAVTGAFGYSGRYIAQRLLQQGQDVITLTNSSSRADPFGGRVRAFPFHFERPDLLAQHLKDVSVLYNTYWVRLGDHAEAVRNTVALFEAAKQAGVERIVHVSITNPSADSPSSYFRGKARLEKALISSGISYAILRPAVLFGKEDILINNIAWTLRRLPVFGVFGDGHYRLQPIYVDDLAGLAVEQGKSRENVVINAIGPETFAYRDLVAAIGQAIGKPRHIMSVPPWLGYRISWAMGKALGDVLVTRDEIEGLMAERLYVNAPPAGTTPPSEWLKANADALGRQYASEVARRKGKVAAYKAQ
jgi:NADH dehydrogenase